MTRTILLLAYGSPSSLEDVERYLTHILEGRTPTQTMIEKLKRRYEAIGGRSPLAEITREQADQLEKRLTANGIPAEVYPAMRHSAPFIKDVVKEAHQRGSRHFIGIPMAPHYSTVSVGGYRTALKEVIQELNDQTDLTFIENWHLNPNLLETWKILIEDQLASTKGDYHVLFTAHSIPQKYISAGDPYRKQIEETASRLLKIFRIKNWSIAYQSASSMGESWIGPTVEEELIRIAKAGLTQVLLTPIGFVSDHLEILYDLDIEAVGSGRKLGLEVRRTGMPNCITPFISALESLAINDLGGRIPQKSLHGD